MSFGGLTAKQTSTEKASKRGPSPLADESDHGGLAVLSATSSFGALEQVAIKQCRQSFSARYRNRR